MIRATSNKEITEQTITESDNIGSISYDLACTFEYNPFERRKALSYALKCENSHGIVNIENVGWSPVCKPSFFR